MFPIFAGNDAGQKVVREDALGAFLFTVDGEGNSLIEEDEIALLLGAAELFRWRFLQHLKEGCVLRTHGTGRIEHLVVGAIQLVFVEGFI